MTARNANLVLLRGPHGGPGRATRGTKTLIRALQKVEKPHD
jgi:hypothetical protein